MATLSINPVSQISSDTDVVTCEIFIAAPRERIFEALTDPKQAAQWWGQKEHYQMSNFNMDLRKGGKWSTTGKSAKSSSKLIRRGGWPTPGIRPGWPRAQEYFGSLTSKTAAHA